ncbi:hypothetical protein [Streptomyces parvus]
MYAINTPADGFRPPVGPGRRAVVGGEAGDGEVEWEEAKPK